MKLKLMISNIILGFASLYFYRLHRKDNRFWAFFFLSIALAAFIGGIYHGFPKEANLLRFVSWSFLSSALFFAQWAVFSKKSNSLLFVFIFLKDIFFLFLSIIYIDFGFLIADSLISMIGFVVFGNLFFTKEPFKWINIGIFISIIAAIVSRTRLTLEPNYLNYNDIGHYITIISLWLISIGVGNLINVSKKTLQN